MIELDEEPDKEKAKKVHSPSKFVGELTDLID